MFEIYLTEKTTKSHCQTLKNINGYSWFGFVDGVHNFQRKENGKYAHIQCEDEQLYNGDIEFMCEHGITLGSERLRKAKKKYSK